MATTNTETALMALMNLDWWTPLKNINIPYSQVGERSWYKITEDLFMTTVSHDVRSGSYLPDPDGPFVTQVVWIRCREALAVAMGDRHNVQCTNETRPPQLLLPPGADGTYRSIVDALGADNFWDRSAYRRDNFRYRMIADVDETYTYYFSSQITPDDELPFAIHYTPERGRAEWEALGVS